MKSLYNIYEVSILGDIDDQIEAVDKSIKNSVEEYIKENYDCIGLKISNKPNKDGLYEVTVERAKVKNKNITSLTNGMFVWKEVEGRFDCYQCKALKSLSGAPKKVGGYFYCSGCYLLKTLEGAPQEVGEDFSCSCCNSLTSLEGAPQEVGEDFSCSGCDLLKTLKGAPQEVGGNFNCGGCKNLSSLKGAPHKVGGKFYCYKCKKHFIEDDVEKVSDVKGIIYC